MANVNVKYKCHEGIPEGMQEGMLEEMQDSISFESCRAPDINVRFMSWWGSLEANKL